MSKTYCGHDWNSMNKILDTLCKLEDDILMTEEEADAFDIAIQCVTDVMNLQVGYSVVLDGDDE